MKIEHNSTKKFPLVGNQVRYSQIPIYGIWSSIDSPSLWVKFVKLPNNRIDMLYHLIVGSNSAIDDGHQDGLKYYWGQYK